MNNSLLTVAIFIWLLAVGLSIWFGFLYIESNENMSYTILQTDVKKHLNDNIGDFLWGTIGIILTFTTTIFLFITFREQRAQLKTTQKQAEKVRFETTYFNILSMLKQVQDTVNANIASRLANKEIKNIVDYYTNFQKRYSCYLNEHPQFSEKVNNFDPLKANSAEIETYKEKIATLYTEMVEETNCNIGYLYRYLFNAIKFVIDDPYNLSHTDAAERYLNLLQAQLSNEELCLLFYNCISAYGENKKGELQFMTILDKYNFLENIDSSFLLNRNQYIFYPHTSFKFLNREELKHVKKKSNND
ncbi:MAG: hypothetical protein HDP34_06225 [Clostridia bacterium]|nr:hypothetical protein [Clostridia bacterium]